MRLAYDIREGSLTHRRMFTFLLPWLFAVSLQVREPERQFDFWIGEWDVLNRQLQADGQWKDTDRTRARITPVCGGAGLFEEWAGPFQGGFMNGMSLRSYDPETELWTILLFWTMDGNGAFGRMHGAFRHGRGEFFSTTQGEQRTRYTFSDALPNTVRWDRAQTTDGGRSWSTNWIMEFERTRAADEVHPNRFFRKPWTEGRLSPHAEARYLDWTLGTWRGFVTDALGHEREARWRSKLVSQDCLVADCFESRAAEGSPWHSEWAVRGWEARPERWAAWQLSSDDPRLRGSTVDALPVQEEGGRPDSLRFVRLAPDGEWIQTLSRQGSDRALITWSWRGVDESAAQVLRTARLQREDT